MYADMKTWTREGEGGVTWRWARSKGGPRSGKFHRNVAGICQYILENNAVAVGRVARRGPGRAAPETYEWHRRHPMVYIVEGSAAHRFQPWWLRVHGGAYGGPRRCESDAEWYRNRGTQGPQIRLRIANERTA